MAAESSKNFNQDLRDIGAKIPPINILETNSSNQRSQKSVAFQSHVHMQSQNDFEPKSPHLIQQKRLQFQTTSRNEENSQEKKR